ncbi:MAG: hypothetical protein GX275_03110 [Clostridiales bacterium]|nr:hypothetical protein [Clostridiales bacterium]
MLKLIKKYGAYLVIIINIVIISIERYIENYKFIDIYDEIKDQLDDSIVKSIYEFFFSFAGEPIIQGISIALLFIFGLYFISLVYYLISRFCKLETNLEKIILTYLKSYSVAIVNKIGRLMYYGFTGSFINNPVVNFIISTIQIILFIIFVNKEIKGDKINCNIFKLIIFVASTLINVGILVIIQLLK